MSVKEFFRRMCKKRVTIVCLILFVAIILMVLLAPLIAPYGADQQDPYSRNLAPSLQHLCGTDNLGRDIFSRLLYGGQVSLALGFIGTIVTTIIGGIIGIISAYYGGKTDNIIMRILDVFMAIPPMLLAMAIVAALGTGIFNTMLAVIISGIPGKARAARGPVLQLKGQEYLEAARAVNTPTWKIMLRHIVPNIMAPMIVTATLSISSTILQVSGLSFLGLGIQPPNPEWGAMLTAGRQYIRDFPWQVLAPGVMMMLTLLSLTIVGDGVRDALDPKLKD